MKLVLDPGHGGESTGAQANGLTEKDWVLDFCRGAYWMLNGLDDAPDVALTRWDDEDLGLATAAELAAKADPDMVVCVHLNAWKDPSVRGGRPFWLEGARPEAERMARALAKALPAEIAGRPARKVTLDDEHYPSVVRLLQPYVARKVPAVLLECGFVTNPGDAAVLQRPQTRLDCLGAILVALRRV